jgi:hypothetical protein
MDNQALKKEHCMKIGIVGFPYKRPVEPKTDFAANPTKGWKLVHYALLQVYAICRGRRNPHRSWIVLWKSSALAKGVARAFRSTIQSL